MMKMRGLALLTLTVLMGAAVGCQGSGRVSTAGNDSTAEFKAVSEETVASASASTETEDEYRISTPYFSVELTGAHRDEFVTSSNVPEDGFAYVIDFFEMPDHKDENGGGHLFSLLVCEMDLDFSFLPSYSEVGILTDENGTSYTLVCEYPSDVQFSQHTQELYNEMADEIPTILKTIKPNEGCQFTFS